MNKREEARRARRRLLLVAGAVLLGGALVADWMSQGPGLLKQLVIGTAQLSVVADVDGAEVALDGVIIGRTPLTRDDLLAGEYTLLVRHPYHPPHVAQVGLPRGEFVRLQVDMPYAEGVLKLATNPQGASVRLDGELLGSRTPIRLDGIAAGEHQIEFSVFGRETIRRIVGVPPGETVELIAELNRVDTGALAIRTKPGRAVVELLDVPLAYEPNVRLPTGKYKVRVRAAGYETRTIDVRLHKGINEIDVTLQRSEGALTVNVAPAGAEVTLRSDGRQLAYVPGMYLPTGVVEVRVRKAGYRTVVRQVSVRSQGHTLNVVLERFTMREGQLIRDPLATGGEAPEVIVVDAGTMQPGGPAGIGEVQSSIVIDQPFAVSVTEVTVGMYRRYAQATGVAVPEVKGMDSDAHPIADISWREASAYVEWLTRQAGHVYRLPTDDEWIYVAWRGRRDVSLCQLGNIADQSLKKVFRQWRTVDCDDGHTRGAPVGSYQPNALGVYDMVGNVSEWMADCGRGGCVSHVVRGSAWDSAGEELELGYRDSFDRAGDTRGIRLIREL